MAKFGALMLKLLIVVKALPSGLAGSPDAYCTLVARLVPSKSKNPERRKACPRPQEEGELKITLLASRIEKSLEAVTELFQPLAANTTRLPFVSQKLVRLPLNSTIGGKGGTGGV